MILRWDAVRRVFCLYGLVAALACGRSSAPDHSTRPRPNLALITIDTLRADRVARGLTPALDALAARGVQFTNARATAPLTLPSHVSIMTGALPPAHGVRENGTHVFGGTPTPLARRLTEMGYRTAAFVGAYVLDRRFGLADGFSHYDDQISRDPGGRERLEAERPGNAVVDRAVAWLKAQTAGPTFVWVHLYDPHAPYNGSYDQDVAFADAQVGRLLHALGPDATIIAAGDHGESLGEHGERTHGMLAYDAALRAPLILVGPGIAPSRRADPVSLADIAETMAGLSRGERRGLLAPPAAEREIYSETEYPRVAGWSPVYALVQDRWKAILSRETELYDLTPRSL
jgi:arylsulfatase A-like enzyme